MEITPESGPGGTVIAASMTAQMPPHVTYDIHFTTGTGSTAYCDRTTGVKTLASVTSGSNGKFHVHATIPANASLGVHGVCAVGRGFPAVTQPEDFTVV